MAVKIRNVSMLANHMLLRVRDLERLLELRRTLPPAQAADPALQAQIVDARRQCRNTIKDMRDLLMDDDLEQ